MKNKFYKDRATEIKRLKKEFKKELLSEKKLATLPKAIQKHFRLSGFVGKPIAMNADIIWEKSFLKLKPNQNWKTLSTLQFNSVNPIMRTTFMKIDKLFFTGKDLYKNGHGSMKGKFFNLFTLINVEGKEISQSALITCFCEIMLLSGYAFQNYICWKEIDKHTVKATLTNYNFKVTGTFYFDEEGKFSYFETYDRFFNIGGKKFIKKKFIAKINSYKKQSNYYQPKNVSVFWHLNTGKYEYFKGSIKQINYNVTV